MNHSRLDDALDVFKEIYRQNPDIGKDRGRATESDTRANVLDRVIHDVLGWPRSNVDREPFANPGYIDYAFHHGRPILLMEAKSEGVSFTLPYQKRPQRQLKISGTLSGDKGVKAAIEQVQKYCSDYGASYGVATNGFSFIVFRAFINGKSWKNERAAVFRDYNDIVGRFNEFWNLLSYEAVSDGHLDAYFRASRGLVRSFYRPLDDFVSSDATYGRNDFNNILRPYVDKFFGDIASQDSVEILNHCYVYSKPIAIIDEALELVIRDEVPNFARGAKPLSASEADQGGRVGERIHSLLEAGKTEGEVVVLMGGIGSGKSTFCKRFFRVVAPGLVSENGRALLVHLNFVGAPEEPEQLNTYLWDSVYDSVRKSDDGLSQRDTLLKIFESDLRAIYRIYEDSSEIDDKINSKIADLYSNRKLFSEAALKYCASRHRLPIVVFDNVDQLRQEAQVQLFTAAQRFSRNYGCLTLLVLREESYNAALMKRHLTAATIKPFHLSSPRFNKLIKLRIDFAVFAAQGSTDEPNHDGGPSYQDVSNLFGLVRRSLLGKNMNIIRLVESVAYGNMRMALELFNRFITSGATDMTKILSIIRDSGGYTVPFHEFTKSVMLGDYKYYRESRSPILNMFNVTNTRGSSHFTALRILSYLDHFGNSDDKFVRLQDLVSDLADLFGNEDDCKETILRLIAVDRQLLELDTRRPETLEGAYSARITASGKYYLDYLVNSFTYCDLAWQDTPIDDRGLSDDLRRALGASSIESRFSRTELFLNYLKESEKAELDSLGDMASLPDYVGPFMPRIWSFYVKERRVIRKKLSS